MRKLAVFFATGFYSGYFPIFPGTIGTIVGVIIYFILTLFNDFIYSAGFIFIFVTGWISVKYSLDYFNHNDPPQIVVDEIIGFLVAVYCIPRDYKYILACFLIFRIMDIFKPAGIRSYIEKLPGEKGIILDDVVAGIYTNLILHGYILMLNR